MPVFGKLDFSGVFSLNFIVVIFAFLFVDMFDKIAETPPKEWFQKMEVFEHTTDLNVLHEVMNAYYTNMKDMYKNNSKIKKIGEL